mgnify:CR=1 FL=1
MTQITSKVCVIGDFAVGKTSTVERFVNNHFSDSYLTTIGVKVDTAEVQLENGLELKLVLWDIAGTTKFEHVEMAYLRGMSGYILVADGTRPATLKAALELKSQIESVHGELPFVFLLNKSDLQHAWEVSEKQTQSLVDDGCTDLFVTSAKTGDQVGRAITRLAELVSDRELSRPK